MTRLREMEAKNKLVSAILSYPPETMAEAERRADEILEALALPVDNTSGDSDG